jgi:serine/threonine-protein kinase
VRFGKYELVSRLAGGGMAELFLARSRSLRGFEKYLVIKRIHRSRTDDAGFVRMLLDEARVAATLDHPNIVQVYDVGHVDGEFFIAMEHIVGHDLGEILRASERVDQAPPPLGLALAIVGSACAGLHHAHGKCDFEGRPLGIVHRDVTPQNLMVTFEGAVKVVDFGIAKAASREVETVAGTLKGKIGYIAPEQCQGLAVDRRADVFALGVVLYELISGTRLYKEASEFETLKKIVDGPVPSLRKHDPGVLPALDDIVTRCLQKDPERRFATARALHGALDDVVMAERLATGMVPLARYMERLFARERESSAGSGLHRLGDDTSPRYSGERGTVAARPPLTRARRRYLVRRWLQAGALGAALLGVGVGLWTWRGQRPAAAPRAVATTPAAAAALSAQLLQSAVEASQLTGRGDEPPQLVTGPLPKPPAQALPLSPTIMCRLLIDDRGHVVKSSVFRARLDVADYEDAAQAAVQHWRFKPALRAGRPVPAWINWPVRFAD